MSDSEAHQSVVAAFVPGLSWVVKLPRLDAETRSRLDSISVQLASVEAHALAAQRYRQMAEENCAQARVYRFMAGRLEGAGKEARGTAYRSGLGLIAYVQAHWSAAEIEVAKTNELPHSVTVQSRNVLTAIDYRLDLSYNCLIDIG